jgi:hypothetical protein
MIIKKYNKTTKAQHLRELFLCFQKFANNIQIQYRTGTAPSRIARQRDTARKCRTSPQKKRCTTCLRHVANKLDSDLRHGT